MCSLFPGPDARRQPGPAAARERQVRAEADPAAQPVAHAVTTHQMVRET